MRNKGTGSSSRSGGCGCGGATAECQCGKASCEQCNLEGFVRPRFFPGQLLTEEDLQLLDAYTIAKNRLHNRAFWGDGVVCGLEVTNHPCDKGTVVVSAGYALDCCGNDIVVACRQELDVNRMVRDLRTKLKGGYDCGDPCADKSTKTPAASVAVRPVSPTGTATFPPGGPSTTNNDDTQVETVPAKYCLYVTYCESESDPVAPYSTGDACGSAGCEPSRVREGFRFELRCDEEEKPRPSIQTAICDCIRDEDRIVKSAKAVMVAGWMRKRYEDASAYAKSPQDGDAPLRLEEANQKLQQLIPDKIDPDWAANKLDEALEAAGPVLTYSARILRGSVDPPAPPVPIVAPQGKKKAAAAAAASDTAMRRAGGTLEWIAGLPSDPVVKKELAEKRTEAERANAEALASKAAFLLRARETGIVDEPERRRVAAGLHVTDALSEATHRLFQDVGGDLALAPRSLPRSAPKLTSIPTFSITDPAANTAAIAYFDNTARSYATFQSGVAEDYHDCFCKSVLPPCSVCQDQSVLLACIDVLDCEVVGICNLERRFVLTPVNLRYWVPEIGRAGKELEEYCCGDRGRFDSFWSQLADGAARACLRDAQAAQNVSRSLQTIYSSAPRSASAVEPSSSGLFGLARIAELEARIRKLEEQQS
jgi:hypothetical protein